MRSSSRGFSTEKRNLFDHSSPKFDYKMINEAISRTTLMLVELANQLGEISIRNNQDKLVLEKIESDKKSLDKFKKRVGGIRALVIDAMKASEQDQPGLIDKIIESIEQTEIRMSSNSTISSLFGLRTKMMKDFLAQGSEEKLDTEVRKANIRDLRKIHQALVEFKKLIPSWTYSYPLDEETGEIKVRNSGSIAEWRSGLIPLQGADSAVGDFTRNILVENSASFSAEDAQKRVGTLVASAKFERPEDQDLVKKWLMSNAGQDNNRFMDFLLASGEYTVDEKGVNIPGVYALLDSYQYKQNWYVDLNQRICVEFDVSYLGLLNSRTQTVLFRDSSTGIVRTMDISGYAEHTKELLMPSVPLMHMTCKIELAFRVEGEKRVVAPKITMLNLSCFAGKFLTSPAIQAQQLAEHKQTAPFTRH